MNKTEIIEALVELGRTPYDPAEFPFLFAEATDNARATVAKLRRGDTNKADIEGAVLLNKKFYFCPALSGKTQESINRMRASKRFATSRPAILLSSDGITIDAENAATGETLHCLFSEIGDQYDFLCPAAGKEVYRPQDENPLDVKATRKLASLYDSLVRSNPEWATNERSHEMNRLMMRLIFCMFAEDVGIFPKNQFSRIVFDNSGDGGEDARRVITQAFMAMNLPRSERGELPSWTAELEYVNGGLFAGETDVPVFDVVSFRYLRDACAFDWREINPDIFGSMIQSVASKEARTELGMHYTSVPNIMKVIGPLFLDDLDLDIQKAWDRPKALTKVMDRMASLRVFDPACGSGNFLVVCYRELRDREITVLKRLVDLNAANQIERFWSSVQTCNFRGIDVADFAVETAKLALFIAEYQANSKFSRIFGRMQAVLPLKGGGRIVCGNSLRTDWETVCPYPLPNEEVFIVGNPPFLGYGSRSLEQNDDMDFVLGKELDSHRRIDFVSCWMFKAANYIRGRNAKAALVATNSICQGQSIGALWPHVLCRGIEICFAHASFKWSNNASANAAVICVVVGIRNESRERKRLFMGEVEHAASNINAYLLDGPNVFVEANSTPIFGLPLMELGNMARDGGNLILSRSEKESLLSVHPEAAVFIKRFVGSDEAINGFLRYCLWVLDEQAADASSIPPVKKRFDAVAKFRSASKAPTTRQLATCPHRFGQIQSWAKTSQIVIPCVSSERRHYLPFDRYPSDVIVSNLAFALYDAPDWCMALIASRLHLVWIGTVCGRLKSDFRYSSTIGWNTFPVPSFTEEQKEQLSASARRILKIRYGHHPASIAELYDPATMPDDLRQAHKDNDELLESMYVGRAFRNDSERLERLFKLYAARIARGVE